MSDYWNEVSKEARSLILDNPDTFKQAIIDDVGFDLNEINGLDQLFHETIVDRWYSPKEAIEVLEHCLNEETDSGLWEGQEWEKVLATKAAFSYGNDVWFEAEKLYNACRVRFSDEMDTLCEELSEEETDSQMEDLQEKAIQTVWDELDNKTLDA